MTRGGRLRAYLELARLSNAPTVVSNAFCGVALGWAPGRGPFPWRVFGVVAAGSAILYAAGMILNDAVDAPIDATERPGRPIPSGRVARSAAFAIAAAMLAAGVGLFQALGARPAAAAALLAACIVLYNILHARSAICVALLGACRGIVYVAAFAAASQGSSLSPRLLALAGGVAAYTAVFSLIARKEAGAVPRWTRTAAWLIPVTTVGVIAGARPDPSIRVLGCSVALLGWQVYAASLWSRANSRPVAAVCSWIAGLCLIDALAVAALGLYPLLIVPALCFVATLAGQRRIVGS